jgi:AraC-like DNA-binding protein
MVHLGTDLSADILADAQGRRAGLPLFTEPEVAFPTGFADQSHLTRWFRRTYGITRTSTNKAGASRPDPTHRAGRRLAGRPQRVAFQAARRTVR